jgi:hypothetical protein
MLGAYELAIVFALTSFTSGYSPFECLEITEAPLLFGDRDCGAVAIMQGVVANADVTSPIVGTTLAVDSLLPLVRPSQIESSIVEGHAGTMVGLSTPTRRNDNRLHVHPGPLASRILEDAPSIETLSTLTPLRVPLPLIQPIKIGIVNDSKLSLREGNKARLHESHFTSRGDADAL